MQPHDHTPRGLIDGALAGLTSYIAHSGGPPHQAYVLPQKVFFALVEIALAIVSVKLLSEVILALL